MSNEQPEHATATDRQSPANQEAGSPAAEQRDGRLADVGSDTPTKPIGEDPPPAGELSAQTNDSADTTETDTRLEGQQQDQASDRNDVPARPDTDSVATERTDTSNSTQRPGEGDDISDAPGALLFSAANGEKLRDQWDSAQTAFVDDPRAAVERADHLVVETIQILSTSFTEERSRLEEQWARGENVSTEDLRVALQRYRSFFDRLLSI